MRDRTGRKADLLGSRRVHGGQGRSQHIHCSIESRGICVEHRTARSKLAHGSLVHKPTQNDLDLAGNKIERCGNTGSSNRQRLQRQPRVYAVRDISGLKRRIQRALPRRQDPRAATAR